MSSSTPTTSTGQEAVLKTLASLNPQALTYGPHMSMLLPLRHPLGSKELCKRGRRLRQQTTSNPAWGNQHARSTDMVSFRISTYISQCPSRPFEWSSFPTQWKGIPNTEVGRAESILGHLEGRLCHESTWAQSKGKWKLFFGFIWHHRSFLLSSLESLPNPPAFGSCNRGNRDVFTTCSENRLLWIDKNRWWNTR